VRKIHYLFFFIALFVSSTLFPSLSQADTHKHQFQLGAGVGLFVGSDNLDAAFDIDLEPEYFITEHISLSGRFDGTVGGTDSVHFGARFRYYFDIPNHERWNLYAGAGAGFMIAFNPGNDSTFGDFAIPVFGFQYDLTKHIKLGSDVSFDIIFDSHNAAFATRLMAIQFKWAF